MGSWHGDIEELVKDNFFLFQYVCKGLRNDPEIIQAAAMQNPVILKYPKLLN